MPAQTVIKFRRDTSANWASANPVLASGEAGYDTTEKKLKIGDGTTAWSGLDFASGSASVVVAETAPTGAEEGNVWYNSTEGTSYIYYDATWVPLSPAIVGPEGPQGPIGETGPTGPQGEPGVGVPTIDSATAGEMLVSNGSTAEWSNTVIGNGSNVPLIVRQNGTQTANLQQWQTSTGGGTVVAHITDGGSGSFTGGMSIRGNLSIGSGTTSGTTKDISIIANSSFPNTSSATIRTTGGTSNPGEGSLSFFATGGVSMDGLLTANPAEPAVVGNTAKAVGYVGLPQFIVSSPSSLSLSRPLAGKHVYVTSNTVTLILLANSSLALEIGTTFVIINGNVTSTITCGDTLRQAGTTNTGDRTLGPYGMATIVKVAATEWIISGNGLS